MNKNTPLYFPILLIIIIAGFLNSCTSRIKADNTANKKQNSSTDTLISENGPPAMVWIPGGEFIMGTDTDPQRRTDEMPAHSVKIDGFWMDITEVTNAQFAEFVKATGYITTAEKPIDWEEIKSQVAPGTPKPSDEMLMPASMVFTQTEMPVDLNNYMNWWTFTKGADWKHPQGPLTSIKDKDDHPVVQVSWDDAVAYCKWAGKRLPTEAEWEFASRGGLNNAIYPWGSDKDLPKYTNSWQGNFPNINTAEDGFAKTAPVKSYAANGYGLFDIAGNVWEWCSDWYDVNYYQACFAKGTIINPSGPDKCNDPNQPFNLVRVKRGGSFLCNDVYCSSYRITARMSTSYDTGQDHSGFRCVKSK